MVEILVVGDVGIPCFPDGLLLVSLVLEAVLLGLQDEGF